MSLDIFDTINSGADLKALAPEQLPQLCDELRRELIAAVARTGGHLSSNLGAVELTVALHRVYDPEKDRILFDVGHQSYTHKLLTGRRDRMDTLRQKDGLSGFPRPKESVCDPFVAGHASNSISAALGMARARTARGEHYDVVAVIGDGALTGGLAYEGLADAGQSGEPLVVVLNDNGMSIDRNVGGMSHLLQGLRLRPGYLRFKRAYRRVMRHLPHLYAAAHSVKEWLKHKLLPDNVFDDLGFYYLGPVDGHDVRRVESALAWAREQRQPVLVHVLTQKGKGFSFAEADPETYHGVGPFDPAVGVLPEERETFSAVFGETLCRLAARDDSVAAVTAAMTGGTGLTGFAQQFPRRFFDVGIAEGHAVTMAAGMAAQGMKPVFAVYSSFLQRGYDMLIHDVALSGLHVVLAVDRAGVTGRDGETHQGTFDISYLGSVPGLTILCPASYAELRQMLETALYDLSGPVALRYPRGGQGAYADCRLESAAVVLRPGTDVTLCGYGVLINALLDAAALLEEQGVSAEVVKLNTVKPLPWEAVFASARRTGALLTAEDVCRAGSVGSALLSRAAELRLNLPVARLDLGDGVVPHGGVEELLADRGLDAAGIARRAAALLGKGGEDR